jgi:hypothetical protein
MTAIKLTKKAQNIVNQIMSSDAIEITHGPIYHLVYRGDITLNSESLDCFFDVDGDSGEMQITNETLNYAKIEDGIIEIDSEHIKQNEYNGISIKLFKLTPIVAIE